MSFELNEQQREIVNAPIGEKAIRVLAGPGAGKTAVMVKRIDRLINKGIRPDSITGVSFSKVAATELGSRIQEVNSLVNLNQICTIHALCFRGLREEGKQHDVATDGRIIRKHVEAALEHVGIHEVGWKDFMSYINWAKNSAVRPHKLETYYQGIIRNAGGLRYYVSWEDEAHTRLANAHRKFDSLLKSEGLMTFADMLCEYEWLLDDGVGVLERHSSKTDHLFIDEAQDTNPQAMRILYKLASPQDNVTIIGDQDQSIFGFTGARPEENMQHGFEERFADKGFLSFMLETNYRSTGKIVSFVNQAIDKNYTEENEQYRKNLIARPDADDGAMPTYNLYPSVDLEAQAVTDKIRDMMWDDDRRPGDFFVLSRIRALLPYLYSYLFHAKIPFVDRCGSSFWDLAHVQDLLAYLSLSVNKSDDVAFQRIYNKASNHMKQPWSQRDRVTGQITRQEGDQIIHRFLGKAFLKACNGTYFGMVDAENQNKTWVRGIMDLRLFLGDMNELESPYDKAMFIIDKCLRNFWVTTEGGTSDEGNPTRVIDMLTVADMVNNFETIEEFLTHANEMKAKIEAATIEGDDSNLVVLSTIHRVKGTERSIVFQMGVVNGILPHWLALPSDGLSTKMDSGSVLPFSYFSSIVDERRLFFVSASRAKEEFHCTGARVFMGKAMEPSEFAYETGLAVTDDQTV